MYIVIKMSKTFICLQYFRNLAVKPLDQVLVTLQYYASGSFMRCVGDMSGLHKSTVCRIIHRVTRAIAKLRPHYINLPANDEEKLAVATDFYKISRFPKVLGAIDCTHIQILSPGKNLLFYAYVSYMLPIIHIIPVKV